MIHQPPNFGGPERKQRTDCRFSYPPIHVREATGDVLGERSESRLSHGTHSVEADKPLDIIQQRH